MANDPNAARLERRPGLPGREQVLDDRVELLLRGVPRLEQVVVEGHVVDRRDRRLGVGICGEQHALGVRHERACLDQVVGARHARHALVGDQHGRLLPPRAQLGQQLQRLRAGSRAQDPVALAEPASQVAGDGSEDRRLVIDSHDRGTSLTRQGPANTCTRSSSVDVVGRGAVLPVAEHLDRPGVLGCAAATWRRTSRIASASPPPHTWPGPAGSGSARTASRSTVVVPGGRPPRSTQRRSTSARVSTAWRSPSSATSASAIARAPAGSDSRIASRAGKPGLVAHQQAPRRLWVRAPSAGASPRSRPRPPPSPRSAHADARPIGPWRKKSTSSVGAVGVGATHREVAPVLLGTALREAPAQLGQHQLLAVVGPAEREDLARLLDARVRERGRLQREARHGGRDPLDRRHGRDAGVEWERPGHRRRAGTTIGSPVSGSSMTRQRSPKTRSTSAASTTLAGSPSATIRPSFMAIRCVA